MSKYKLVKKLGFTLIELIVIIGILGVLSAITLFFVSEARNRAREQAVNAQFGRLRTQLEVNAAGNPSYTGACAGQAVKNIVQSLQNLTNSNAACYNPPEGTEINGGTDNVCGCHGGQNWVFWIDLGSYDGDSYFTCLSSDGVIFDKLTQLGGSDEDPSCSQS